MYLGRAKKNLEKLDQEEFDKKQAKFEEKKELEQLNLKLKGDSKASKSKLGFKPDELPDGTCARSKNVTIDSDDQTTAVRKAEVIS